VLRAIISTWVRLAIFETMGLAERDARLWFVVDELDALALASLLSVDERRR